MNLEAARNLLVNEKKSIKQPERSLGEFNCFNNNNIGNKGTIQVDIQSGSSLTENCTILLVDINTFSIMGRDVIKKIGLLLSMSPKEIEGENKLYNISYTHQKLFKWIFHKYPHLCRRLSRSRNHVAKSTFKNEFHSTENKGRRIPLYLTEKNENELRKLIAEKDQKINEMLR